MANKEAGMNTGGETVGVGGDKNKVALFKDDRHEDIGTIIVAVLVVVFVILVTMM